MKAYNEKINGLNIIFSSLQQRKPISNSKFNQQSLFVRYLSCECFKSSWSIDVWNGVQVNLSHKEGKYFLYFIFINSTCQRKPTRMTNTLRNKILSAIKLIVPSKCFHLLQNCFLPFLLVLNLGPNYHQYQYHSPIFLNIPFRRCLRFVMHLPHQDLTHKRIYIVTDIPSNFFKS